MVTIEAKHRKAKSLVNPAEFSDSKVSAVLRKGIDLTKTHTQLQRVEIPRIREHKNGKRFYYTYYQGPELPEIYLGKPENILRKVKGN